MAVEIREVVLTARVTERTPAAARVERDEAPIATRELIEACLAEVRLWLDRRTQR